MDGMSSPRDLFYDSVETLNWVVCGLGIVEDQLANISQTVLESQVGISDKQACSMAITDALNLIWEGKAKINAANGILGSLTTIITSKQLIDATCS